MAFSPETEKLVEQLIQAEYETACEDWGEKYNSLHEAYAILKEEIEEVIEEIKNIEINIHNVWRAIKENAIVIAKDECLHMRYSTIMSIKELAQVGAVLQKIQNTIGEVKE